MDESGTDHIPFLDHDLPTTDDAKRLLDLLEQSSRIQRDDIRAVGENHMDLSERALANFAAARTISDGSKALEILGSDPTQCPTR